MATFTLEELITPLETEEIKASIYAALATVGVTTTTWKPGAVTRTIIAIVAVVLHALSVLVSNIARAGFLELSSGSWLALVAKYVYKVDKQTATFAAGTVLVSNSSGGVYNLDPDDLEVSSSITGKSFKNTAAVVINAGASNVLVAVRAVEAGSASSALVGEVDTVVTALAGLTVTNTAALIGLDDESDESLKAKAADKLGSFSPNGPADAYSFVARTALRSDGTPIGVTRVRTVPDGIGGLDVYCATASGILSVPDLALVDEAIQTQAAPLAVTVRVHNATPVAVAVSYSTWAYNTTGVTVTQFTAAVRDGLALYFANTPIGGNILPAQPGAMYHDDIRAEIGRSKYRGASLRVFRTALSAPAADVALAANEVPVLGVVTPVATTFVAPPRGAV